MSLNTILCCKELASEVSEDTKLCTMCSLSTPHAKCQRQGDCKHHWNYVWEDDCLVSYDNKAISLQLLRDMQLVSYPMCFLLRKL